MNLRRTLLAGSVAVTLLVSASGMAFAESSSSSSAKPVLSQTCVQALIDLYTSQKSTMETLVASLTTAKAKSDSERNAAVKAALQAFEKTMKEKGKPTGLDSCPKQLVKDLGKKNQGTMQMMQGGPKGMGMSSKMGY